MTEYKAFLKPLTPEAEACLGTKSYAIAQFPFRVGRESRRSPAENFPDSRRRQKSTPNNDLYLAENEGVLNVSREHFQIEMQDEGYLIVDCGSACGTIVEGASIGGNRKGGQTRLADGDVIIVGTSKSRFVFKFIVSESAV